jgi:ribosome-associated protein
MDDDEFISKTRLKKRMAELQDVGAELVKLSPEQLARIEMPESLRDAVIDCQSITKHEARRRQMQYIGRIMRDLDAAPIVAQLEGMHAPSKKQTALFHVAEKWRDELLSQPDAAARFAREFPSADAHRLRVLVSAAGEERKAGRAPKHARELFHFVNAIVQEEGKSA